MGKYIIILTGLGAHHSGIDEDADKQLRGFIDGLLKSGQEIHHASIQIEGSPPEILIGVSEDAIGIHPPTHKQSLDATTDDLQQPLDIVLTHLQTMDGKLDKLLASEKKKKAAPTPPKPASAPTGQAQTPEGKDEKYEPEGTPEGSTQGTLEGNEGSEQTSDESQTNSAGDQA
jgi:hypothetical protein